MVTISDSNSHPIYFSGAVVASAGPTTTVNIIAGLPIVTSYSHPTVDHPTVTSYLHPIVAHPTSYLLSIAARLLPL